MAFQQENDKSQMMTEMFDDVFDIMMESDEAGSMVHDCKDSPKRIQVRSFEC